MGKTISLLPYSNSLIMKSLVFCLLILTANIISVFGQNDFKVIRVNGDILIKSRNISLETGTVFYSNEDLLFKTDDATAAVINAQKGRLVITSRDHDLSAAKSNYLPSMYNISSRGGIILNNADLGSVFSGKYVILERQGITLDKNAFPMDNNNFFFLRYTYKGETINKKLPFSGDTLLIEKKSLLTVDGNPIPGADNTKIKLYYRKGNESILISEFDLIFPDMKQLEKEVGIILNEMKGKTADEKINETGAFIGEFYGKTDRDCLANWLASRFSVK